MRAEPLAPEDTARLHMAVPANPMVIAAALLFDGRLPLGMLRARLEARLLRHARFRMRVAEPRFGLGTPRWVEDATFDLRSHVVEESLAPEGEPARAFERFASERVSEPLDPRRPLWRMHLVHADGRSTLLVRVHHCIADGEALVGLLDELSDGAPAGRRPLPDPRRPPLAPRRRRVLGGLWGAARLALRRPDSLGPLHAPDVLSRRAIAQQSLAFSQRLDLAALKHTAHALGTTVTALHLAAVAGALRAEVESRSRARLHALVPVSVRHTSAPDGEPGNRFASVFLPLPVGASTPRARVRRVEKALRVARRRSAAVAGQDVLGAAAAATAFIERRGVAFMSARASVTVSSVRGPTEPLSMGGIPVRDIVVWAPAPGAISLAATLMSYAGRVRIGVVAGGQVAPAAEPIAAAVVRELAALEAAARAPMSARGVLATLVWLCRRLRSAHFAPHRPSSPASCSPSGSLGST
jgi:diacylglycerol O-acyltransferase